MCFFLLAIVITSLYLQEEAGHSAEDWHASVWVQREANGKLSMSGFQGPSLDMGQNSTTKKPGVSILSMYQGSMKGLPYLAMGQNPVPPVNIPIPTKIGS